MSFATSGFPNYYQQGHYGPPLQYQTPPPPPPVTPNRYSSLPSEQPRAPPGVDTTPKVTVSTVNTVAYVQRRPGAPITEGIAKAYEECKATVLRIASQCKAKNRKFRDVEFDIENDPSRCLYNLSETNIFVGTSDARRVSEIFDNPVFYSGTNESAQVIQGAVEDCYFVSALSTLTSMDRLVQNFCVARDEEVGVYGFIFYRDCYWVPVIIDDLLFTRLPRYEQLRDSEKELYHFEKEKYNKTARKGAETLYFSRPVNGSQETWMPLAEKAYAKLHGDYASLMFGRTCDAIEDITGGVSSLILSRDILDRDKFWEEELVKANKDRLFGCWFKTLPGMRTGIRNASVNGLVGNLSYSVVRAVEINGKRFVVVRDSWGDAGWDGPWSDGSKEWTKEWLEVLPQLEYSFGEKGQFVMEYHDFLNVWQEIQRTLIFDDNWIMSSQWLHISQPFPCMDAFSFGDVAFTFSLPTASPAVIALSKYNSRYFRDIQGPSMWNLDFILAKEGETESLAESSYSFFYTRSVSVELDLEAGNYIVLARLDAIPFRPKDYFTKSLDSGWDRRKLARIMTERAKGQSIAANYTPNPQLLPTSLSTVLSNESVKDKSGVDALKTYGKSVNGGDSVTVSTTTTTLIQKKGCSTNQGTGPYSTSTNVNNISSYPGFQRNYYFPDSGFGPGNVQFLNSPPASPPHMLPKLGPVPNIPISPSPSPPPGPSITPIPVQRVLSPAPLQVLAPPLLMDTLEDDNSLVVGLKVYTMKHVPVTISGRVKNSRQCKQTGHVKY